MSVDKNGYISRPQYNGIQPEFSHVIDDVISILNDRFPDHIHSMYVYGSVAEGKAKSGISDLDITVVFVSDMNSITMKKLALARAEIERNNSIISKIDFDCASLKQVLNADNHLSWGYWLKHHCICVFGEDLGRKFELFRPSRSIAIAVNGDFISVIENYIEQLRAETDIKKQQQLQRAAARKAIRATNILRNEYDKDWPDTLQEHCEKIRHQYPALAEDIGYLLTMGVTPCGEISYFIEKIKHFIRWLDIEFHRKQSR